MAMSHPPSVTSPQCHIHLAVCVDMHPSPLLALAPPIATYPCSSPRVHASKAQPSPASILFIALPAAVLLGNSPATLVGSGPSPYSPYPAHPAVDATRAMSGGGGGQRASLKEQVDAATDTSTRAVEATASGRYSGVHEVARPGSRREEELRAVLQEEIAKESERQAILVKVTWGGGDW